MTEVMAAERFNCFQTYTTAKANIFLYGGPEGHSLVVFATWSSALEPSLVEPSLVEPSLVELR